MNQNQYRGLMIVLIVLVFVISTSFNNLANAIRDLSESSNNGDINYEIYRFNDNFEKYLEILQNDKTDKSQP